MSAYVYVILTDSGEIKVGLSGTPYARLSKIKREYGERRGFKDAQLVGFVDTSYALLVESLVHRRIEAHATGGEWFRMDGEEALSIVLEEARGIDCFARLIRPSPSPTVRRASLPAPA